MLTNEIKEYATQIGNKIPLLKTETYTKKDFCIICHQLMFDYTIEDRGDCEYYRHALAECREFQELYVYTFRGEPWEYDGDYWDD